MSHRAVSLWKGRLGSLTFTQSHNRKACVLLRLRWYPIAFTCTYSSGSRGLETKHADAVGLKLKQDKRSVRLSVVLFFEEGCQSEAPPSGLVGHTLSDITQGSGVRLRCINTNSKYHG